MLPKDFNTRFNPRIMKAGVAIFAKTAFACLLQTLTIQSLNVQGLSYPSIVDI